MSPKVSDISATQGAYPSFIDGKWRIDVSPIQPFIADYFERSAPHIDAKTSSFGQIMAIYEKHEMEHDFPTNEGDYARAISSIAGRGGALMGVGHILPIIYGAWAESSHIYVMDILGEVPFALVPMWGALFLIARNRAEFLSLLSGKPLKPGMAESFDRMKAGALAQSVLEIPFDVRFSYAVAYGLESLLTSKKNPLRRGDIGEVIDTQLHVFRKFDGYQKLLKADEQGRGGPLSSDEAFQRSRAIFAEGRITGMASDIVGAGLDEVVRQTQAAGTPIRTIYISNIPDWMNNRAAHETGDAPLQYIHDFYRRLSEIPSSQDAVVISSTQGVYTTSYPLPRHIGAWIPMDLSPVEAGKIARMYYRFHLQLAWSWFFPPEKRLEGILSSPRNCDIRYRAVFATVQDNYHGRPFTASEIKNMIGELGLAERIPNWEQKMLIHFLACVGLAEDDLSEASPNEAPLQPTPATDALFDDISPFLKEHAHRLSEYLNADDPLKTLEDVAKAIMSVAQPIGLIVYERIIDNWIGISTDERKSDNWRHRLLAAEILRHKAPPRARTDDSDRLEMLFELRDDENDLVAIKALEGAIELAREFGELNLVKDIEDRMRRRLGDGRGGSRSGGSAAPVSGATPASTVSGLVEDTDETSGGANVEGAAQVHRATRGTAGRSQRRYGHTQLAGARTAIRTTSLRPIAAPIAGRTTVVR